MEDEHMNTTNDTDMAGSDHASSPQNGATPNHTKVVRPTTPFPISLVTVAEDATRKMLPATVAGNSKHKHRSKCMSTVNTSGSQKKTNSTAKSRFGVTVNTMMELKDSIPTERKFRFRLKTKGFGFWAEARKTAANGIEVAYPWPKTVRVEDDAEREIIEAQVVEKLGQALGDFDEALKS